jgi:2'-hydroxyisoflavone reductase
MRVLIIGGTRFVGWHIVTACVNRGHDVTLLNRGVSAPDQWPDLERIGTDRRAPDARARQLLRRGWDLVIDCCAYTAQDLAVVHLLRDHMRHYTLISSYAVHAPASAPGKRSCEQRTAQILSGIPTLVLRLGLTIGPRDPSGRLGYWVERCLAGGDALVPMEYEQPLRFVDVRDAAACAVDAATAASSGPLDLQGPRIAAGELLSLIGRLTGDHVRWRWMPEATALAEGLRPWTQVPLWIPADDTIARRLMTRRPSPAPGLRNRALPQALDEFAAWYSAHRRRHPDWLAPSHEEQLIGRLGLVR